MSTAAAIYVPPVFSAPVRWTLRVLSWLAFGISAYLAWHAISQSSVAGCGFGAANGCDQVLTSSWSKWLGLPVAALGLACYSVLAGLSVLLGPGNPGISRWINTAFVALAIVAAGASVWFIGLQIFVIGSICIYCMATDICGIAIGVIAVGSTIRWLIDTSYLRRRGTAAGLTALRTALPGVSRTTPAPNSAAPKLPTPSLRLASAAALSLLIALLAGQILLPSKTHSLETGTLNESIELVGSNRGQSKNASEDASSQPHVAMRVPSDRDREVASNALDSEVTADPLRIGENEAFPFPSNDDNLPTSQLSNNGLDGNGDSAGAGASTINEATPEGEASESDSAEPERIVTFLGGKLTLDVYKHPLIGSPQSPHVIIEMVSYDCPHCRKMHRTIKRGLDRYSEQLAVIVMPIPLEKGCNQFVTTAVGSYRGACATARLAIGVAAVRRSAFPAFHDWLMSGDTEKAPPIEKILPKAYKTVDRSRLRSFIRGDEVDQQIADYVNVYGLLRSSHSGSKQFGLPVQILGDQILSGSVEDEEDVFKAWEEHLGLEPR